MSNIFDSSYDTYVDSESVDSSIDNLLKGSQVVLVDSDNPWYLNKELKIGRAHV